jgi:hypothetical protein
MVIGVAFGTAAASDTPFLQADGTTEQVALFVPFVAFMDHEEDVNDISTALSVSNILAAPEGILPEQGLGNDKGSIEIYLFTSNGELIVFETEDNSVGNFVLDDDGQLAPGRTWQVQIKDILEATDSLPPVGEVLSGYAWVIANFDAAQGTSTIFYPSFGFAQGLSMQPTITADNIQGGIPVVVP